MNAKEKALKLCQKFGATTMFSNDNEGMSLSLEISKQCAIICVDELIKALQTTTGHCDLRLLDRHEVNSDFDYWNDVKQEIEKL